MPYSQRRLPQLSAIGQPLFVTFRLHGSLPPGREFPKESMTSGKAFVYMDRLLDHHRAGPMYLAMPSIAQLVANSIEGGSLSDYLLHAWVIMPNHVHLLITPQEDVAKLMQKLKGTTAREANQMFSRAGVPFWQHESYDHLVRNADEYWRIADYIVQNPVQAGLAASAEEYRWSGGLKPAAS